MACSAAIVLGVLLILALAWAVVMTVYYSNTLNKYNEIANTPQGAVMTETINALDNEVPEGYVSVPYGHRVSGGAVMYPSSDTTLEDCVDACNERDTCTAVRYNYDTNECKYIAAEGISTSDLSLNNLVEASFVQDGVLE